MLFKSLGFKAEEVSLESRIFAGYAATWDKDQGGDVIIKGAFAKTLAERGDRVKILWQHSDPIGKPLKMTEDDKGLFVEGRISKTRLGDEALELMRDGVVDQMSIGYSVPANKSEYDEATGTRYIKELKLFEFSPVTFPMNENAFITGVKSIIESGRVSDEVIKLIDDLNALVKGEPRKHSAGVQPQQLDELKLLLKSFGR